MKVCRYLLLFIVSESQPADPTQKSITHLQMAFVVLILPSHMIRCVLLLTTVCGFLVWRLMGDCRRIISDTLLCPVWSCDTGRCKKWSGSVLTQIRTKTKQKNKRIKKTIHQSSGFTETVTVRAVSVKTSASCKRELSRLNVF